MTTLQAVDAKSGSLGFAHAKSILVGEHAVVYGKPAIAFPVHSLPLVAQAKALPHGFFLRTPYHSGEMHAHGSTTDSLEQSLADTALRNTLDFLGSTLPGISVTITGMIPPARGLGSSAAVAGAIAQAVAQLHGVVLSEIERFDLVQSVERVAHGTPSGLDAHATTSVGPIWFEDGKVTPLQVKRAPHLLIADTGISGHTSQAVTHVRNLYDSDPHKVGATLEEIATITHEARHHLISDNLSGLGEVMSTNHSLLSTLDVSHEVLDHLVSTAQSAGALGAKLTGGGLGGCIVALANSRESMTHIQHALLEAGATAVWPVGQGEERYP